MSCQQAQGFDLKAVADDCPWLLAVALLCVPVLEQRSASAGAGSLLSSSTSLMDLSQLRGDLLNAMGR